VAPVPMATTTISTSNTNSRTGMGMGRRRRIPRPPPVPSFGTFHPADPAVLFSQYLHRQGEEMEFNPFFLGMVDFFDPAGTPLRTAVDDVDFIRPQAEAGGGPSPWTFPPPGQQPSFPGRWSIILGEEIGLHQVGTGQVSLAE